MAEGEVVVGADHIPSRSCLLCIQPVFSSFTGERELSRLGVLNLLSGRLIPAPFSVHLLGPCFPTCSFSITRAHLITLTVRTPRVKRSLLSLTVMRSMCEGRIQEIKMSIRPAGFGFKLHLFQGFLRAYAADSWQMSEQRKAQCSHPAQPWVFSQALMAPWETPLLILPGYILLQHPRHRKPLMKL